MMKIFTRNLVACVVGVCFMGSGTAFAQEAVCKAATANLSVLAKNVQTSRQNMRKQCVFFRSCKMACRSNKKRCIAGKKPKDFCAKWMPQKCANVCKREADKPDCKKAQDAFWASVKTLEDATALPACKAAYPMTKGDADVKK